MPAKPKAFFEKIPTGHETSIFQSYRLENKVPRN